MDNKEKLANSFIYAIKNIKDDKVNVAGLNIPVKRLLDQAYYVTGDPSLHPSFDINKRLENARTIFTQAPDTSKLPEVITADDTEVVQVIHDFEQPLETRELFYNSFNQAFDETIPTTQNIQTTQNTQILNTPREISAMQNGVSDKAKDIAGQKLKGILGNTSKNVAQNAVKTGTQVAVKTGTKLGLKAIGGAIAGALTGGLSLLATFALDAAKGLLRRISPTLAKYADKLSAISLALAAGSLIAPGLLAPAAAFGAAAYAGGGAAAFSAGVGIISNGLYALLGAAIGMIATPIILTLIFFPIILASIMFVINSGAYVVPPGGPVGVTSGGSTNDFQFGIGPGGAYPHCWPVNFGRITQLNHGGTYGSSIDIGVPNGTPVYATHDGIATYHPWSEPNHVWGYGNYIIVRSTVPEFTFTLYAHLESSAFTGTVQVNAGDLIGKSDNTGENSHGQHLHYEIRPASVLIYSALPPEQNFSEQATIAGCFAQNMGGSTEFGQSTGSSFSEGTSSTSPQTQPVCSTNNAVCTDSCPSECQIRSTNSFGWLDCNETYCCSSSCLLLQTPADEGTTTPPENFDTIPAG